MKDIPTEELAEISAEIHEAAVRVGCIHVSVTGMIWPGARAIGAPEEAARFVEFSWLRAAVINGRAIFEDADPRAYHELLVRYGLEDQPYAQPGAGAGVPQSGPAPSLPSAPEPVTPVQSERVELIVSIKAKTKREIEAQAAEAGLSISAFLDVRFNPGSGM